MKSGWDLPVSLCICFNTPFVSSSQSSSTQGSAGDDLFKKPLAPAKKDEKQKVSHAPHIPFPDACNYALSVDGVVIKSVSTAS